MGRVRKPHRAMGLRADGKKGSKRSLKTASKKCALPPKLIRPDDKGTEGSEGGEDKDTGGKGRRERAPRPEKKRRRGEATEESEEDAAAAAAKDAKQRRKAVAQLTGQKANHMKAAEFKAMRERSARAAALSAAEQAEWVWANHVLASGAAPLEREGFGGEHMMEVAPGEGGVVGAVKGALVGASRDFKAPAPVVLLLSGSATAANSAAKALGRQPACGRVAKLFAKHMKLNEQRAKLAADPGVLVGAGTPHRITALLSAGAFSLERLALVVLDVQLDAKGSTTLDIAETRAHFSSLFKDHLLPRLIASRTRLCLADCSQL